MVGFAVKLKPEMIGSAYEMHCDFCTCSRTDSDGYGAFSPPSPGTPVTPRLGSGVGPAPGPASGASGLAAGGTAAGPAAFAGPTGCAGLTQPPVVHGAGSAVRPLQVNTTMGRTTKTEYWTMSDPARLLCRRARVPTI